MGSNGGFYIDPSCDIRGIDRMNLGNGVVIQKDCWLNIAYNNPRFEHVIEIGEGSNLGRRTNISATNRIIIGKNVLTAPNVHITDHNHEYRKIGIPIINQGVSSIKNEIIIGDGTWIGINSVVIGNVCIGRGCVIGANSVVTSDIPDYCVAAGNPAKIIKLLDYESGDWVRVSKKANLKELLLKRKEAKPLISICIASYNKARELETCLNTIFNQIGDDPFIEVIVCDNASELNIGNVVKGFSEKYSNLKYYRNETNIGTAKNFLRAIELSNGTYFFLHSDDDFFIENTLYSILNTVNENRDRSVFFLNTLNGSGQIDLGSGIDNYLRDTSIYSTFISAIIIKRSEYEKIPVQERLADININQVYLQYRVLLESPDYCIINYAAYWQYTGSPKGYNFGEIFIKSYLDILEKFSDKGIRLETIKEEKYKMLYNMVMPWYRRIIAEKLDLDVSNFSEIFKKYYSEELYFMDFHREIQALERRGEY